MTTKEYAAKHGYTESYIRRLCRQGRILATRIETGRGPVWVIPAGNKIRPLDKPVPDEVQS